MPSLLSSWKWLSLFVFCAQNSLNSIIQRYALTEAASQFRAATSAILFFTEVLKLIFSLGLLVSDLGFGAALAALVSDARKHPNDMLWLAVPAVIYSVQNGLTLLSIAHLSAAVWQVTYQGKILVTAFFSVILLQKQILRAQWLAIAAMGVGIAIVQLSGPRESRASSMGNAVEQNWSKGMTMLLCSCCCSGFANVFAEMLFKRGGVGEKSSEKSVWMQNAHLALFSMLVTLLCFCVETLSNGSHHAAPHGASWGLFDGFTARTWSVCVNNAIGGLLVALVMKYADNLLRGFASAIATLNCALISVVCFGFDLSFQFLFGAVFVVGSALLYGGALKLPGDWWNSEPSLFFAAVQQTKQQAEVIGAADAVEPGATSEEDEMGKLASGEQRWQQPEWGREQQQPEWRREQAEEQP